MMLKKHVVATIVIAQTIGVVNPATACSDVIGRIPAVVALGFKRRDSLFGASQLVRVISKGFVALHCGTFLRLRGLALGE